jgi:hypothetical protein
MIAKFREKHYLCRQLDALAPKQNASLPYWHPQFVANQPTSQKTLGMSEDFGPYFLLEHILGSSKTQENGTLTP